MTACVTPDCTEWAETPRLSINVRLASPNLVPGDAFGQHWKLVRLLGKGAEGEVWLATRLESEKKKKKKDVALKILNAAAADRNQSFRGLWTKIRHSNVISPRCLWTDGGGQTAVELELCDMDLLDRVNSAGRLCEREASPYFLGITRALAFVHAQNVAHRDVKPENVLLKVTSRGVTAKLADWGSAVVTEPFTLDADLCVGSCSFAEAQAHGTPLAAPRPAGPTLAPTSPAPFVGSDLYMAPEVAVAGGSAFGCDPFAADIWSLGATLLAAVAGYLPWTRTSPAKEWPIPLHLSPELRDLLTRLLSPDPAKRGTAAEAARHPWFAAAAAAAAATTATAIAVATAAAAAAAATASAAIAADCSGCSRGHNRGSVSRPPRADGDDSAPCGAIGQPRPKRARTQPNVVTPTAAESPQGKSTAAAAVAAAAAAVAAVTRSATNACEGFALARDAVVDVEFSLLVS
ncbi:unnamed protein product [Phaeothamnion confervicola]